MLCIQYSELVELLRHADVGVWRGVLMGGGLTSDFVVWWGTDVETNKTRGNGLSLLVERFERYG